MNSGDPRPRELSNEEIAQALDWVDGELETQSATAFELRLSQDRELARQVEALVGVDALLRREARVRAGSMSSVRPIRSVRKWGGWVALAAACLALMFILSKIFESKAPECEVALAPSFALAEDWLSQQPGLEGASAPGIAVSRGENQRHMTAEEFLAASNVIESSIVSSALEQKRKQIEAGWFVVPIELDSAAWVSVLSFPAKGKAEMLFPSPNSPGNRIEASLPKGRSLLPSNRAVPGRAPETLEYKPGFLVPLGAQKLTLLVATRELREGANPPWQEIDGWIASGETADQISERLSGIGFAVQRLSVREPK